jgi:hypothetical protein
VQELHGFGAAFRLALADRLLESLQHLRREQVLQGVAVAGGEGADHHLIGAAGAREKPPDLKGGIFGAHGGDAGQALGRIDKNLGRQGVYLPVALHLDRRGIVLRLTSHAPSQHRIELEQHHCGQAAENDQFEDLQRFRPKGRNWVWFNIGRINAHVRGDVARAAPEC